MVNVILPAEANTLANLLDVVSNPNKVKEGLKQLVELSTMVKNQQLDLDKQKADLAMTVKQNQGILDNISQQQAALDLRVANLDQKDKGLSDIKRALDQRDQDLQTIQARLSPWESSLKDKESFLTQQSSTLAAQKADLLRQQTELDAKNIALDKKFAAVKNLIS